MSTRPELGRPDFGAVTLQPAAIWRFRWWMPQLVLFGLAACLVGYAATRDVGSSWFEVRSAQWWVLTTVLHLPFAVILFFLTGGLIERLGFFWKGRTPAPPGWLPPVVPTVCVQLPMFNEHAVAQRVIEAAAAMSWPAGRLTIQVLDDSTDSDTRALVAAGLRPRPGVDRRELPRTPPGRSSRLQGGRARGRAQGDRRRVHRDLRRRLPAAAGTSCSTPSPTSSWRTAVPTPVWRSSKRSGGT